MSYWRTSCRCRTWWWWESRRWWEASSARRTRDLSRGSRTRSTTQPPQPSNTPQQCRLATYIKHLHLSLMIIFLELWLSDECHDNQHFYNYCILCRKIAKCVFSTRTYAKVYPVRHIPFSSQWDLLRLTWGWKIPGSAPRWADGGLQVHRAQWESGHRRPADLAGSWACPEGRWEARPEGQWEAHPEGQWEVRPDHRRQAPLWSDRRRPTSNRSIPKSRPKTDWKLCELSEPDTD